MSMMKRISVAGLSLTALMVWSLTLSVAFAQGKIVGTGASGTKEKDGKAAGGGKLVGTGVTADQSATSSSDKTNIDQIARAKYFDAGSGRSYLLRPVAPMSHSLQ
jgi:hypothetical protein